MEIGLAQIRIERASLDENRGRAVDAVERAASEGCDLVVLPDTAGCNKLK